MYVFFQFKKNKFFGGSKTAPPPYGAPYVATPVPSTYGVTQPAVYGTVPAGQAPIVEVPVEVPVPVPVEPPQVIPVMDESPGYGGYNDGYSAYGGCGYGQYGGQYQPYGGYIDEQPVFGPAAYGDIDKFWM